MTGSQPTAEEMEGRTIGGENYVDDSEHIAKPKPKSKFEERAHKDAEPTIIDNPPQDAPTSLSERLQTLRVELMQLALKASRLERFNENLDLVQELVKAGRGADVTEMHEIIDEGKDVAA